MTSDNSNTEVRVVENSGAQIKIEIVKLAGFQDDLYLPLYDTEGNLLKLRISRYNSVWLLHLATNIRTYVGTEIVIQLVDDRILSASITQGAYKYKGLWMSVVGLKDIDIQSLSEFKLQSFGLFNKKRQSKNVYNFSLTPQLHYRDVQEGQELLRLVCFKLLCQFNKLQTVTSPQNDQNSETSKPSLEQTRSYYGQLLNKQYNLSTKYGRHMANKQALYNYHHGSQEYRDEIDRIKYVFWLIVICICVIVFIIVWNVGGPEAAIKWLK